MCRLIIERLYGMSGELNEKGQSSFYGKNGGTVITGNEDGIKHCAMSILHVDPSCRSFMSILHALGHPGYTTPPQAPI